MQYIVVHPPLTAERKPQVVDKQTLAALFVSRKSSKHDENIAYLGKESADFSSRCYQSYFPQITFKCIYYKSF